MRPIGIGPIISCRSGDAAYYFDVLYPDGQTERLSHARRTHKLDRPAKIAAIHQRSRMIEALRPGIVVTHDQTSFDALVGCFGAAAAA